MVVLVAVVVGLVVFRDANRQDPRGPVKEVDYTQAADFARQQASFEVLAPASLPEGWRATTVEYRPGTNDRWHLGLLTDQDRYVGLEQSDDSVGSMVKTYVDPDAAEGAPARVGGEPWSTYSDPGGDLALVRRQDGVTTLVVGHEVPQDDLVAFTASLR